MNLGLAYLLHSYWWTGNDQVSIIKRSHSCLVE